MSADREKRKRRILDKLEKLRERRKKAHRRKKPMRQPRYDEVYFEGLKWLDSL